MRNCGGGAPAAVGFSKFIKITSKGKEAQVVNRLRETKTGGEVERFRKSLRKR